MQETEKLRTVIAGLESRLEGAREAASYWAGQHVRAIEQRDRARDSEWFWAGLAGQIRAERDALQAKLDKITALLQGGAQ